MEEKRKKTFTDRDKKPAVRNKKGVCPVAGRCGGCQYQGVPYEKQLEEKQKQVQSLLGSLAPVHKIRGMEDPKHYRNKVHATFHYTKKHELISGIYEENSHRVIPVTGCMIEDPKADAIVQSIRSLMPSFKIKAYDEDTGYGLLRHVLIRTGHYTGQVLVVLVLVSPILPSRNNFVKALLKLHPEITSIVVNVNERHTSMVLGDKEAVIYGKGYIEDTIGECTFRISPKSFYQVNPVQTQNLYAKALELAELTGEERVIDAYCGTGTIGILAAAHAGEVIGVELNHDAVRDAVVNAKNNQVKNIRFYEKDAGDFLVQMASQGEHADVIIMDPPRAGSSEEFIRSVGVLAPERVVYVSCNPETLARDVRLLKKQGYMPRGFWPYDMFPFTAHAEVVAVFDKKNVKNGKREGKAEEKKAEKKPEARTEKKPVRDSVRTGKRVKPVKEKKYAAAGYTPEPEMDGQSIGGRTTYGAVKQYIYEKYAVDVSALQIGLTKDKLGIDRRVDYQENDPYMPKCPPEKEKMIREAMKHYGL